MVNSTAFERPNEATIVNALKEQVEPVRSLVAEEKGKVVGHSIFSPVRLQQHVGIMELGPMAVSSQYQRQGIGTLLIEAGFEKYRKLDVGAVVVLRHPEYYPKLNFSPAYHFDLECEYQVPKEIFMVQN